MLPLLFFLFPFLSFCLLSSLVYGTHKRWLTRCCNEVGKYRIKTVHCRFCEGKILWYMLRWLVRLCQISQNLYLSYILYMFCGFILFLLTVCRKGWHSKKTLFARKFLRLWRDIIQKGINMLKRCESETSLLDQAKDTSQVLQNTDIKFWVPLKASNCLIRRRLTGCH